MKTRRLSGLERHMELLQELYEEARMDREAMARRYSADGRELAAADCLAEARRCDRRLGQLRVVREDL